MPDRVTRRGFVKGLAVTAGATVLAACKPQVVKETVVVEKPVKEVVKETVVVEKAVKETVVVTEEKVVTVTPAPLEQIELLFQYREGGYAGEGFEARWEKEGLPRFQEIHPNINVAFTIDVLPEKLIASFVAGNAPDVMAQCCEILPDFASMGQMLDLQPYMDMDLTEEDLNDWSAKELAFWHLDGGQYGLPMANMQLALYYNMDMFDEAGIDYPPRRWNDAWTYDEYAEAMQKLVKTGADGKIEHWGSQGEQWPARIQNHVNAFGGHFVDPEDNTHCLLGEPEALEALWWIYDLTWEKNGYVPLGLLGDIGQWQTFESGKTAMNENGPWQLSYTVTAAEFNWNFAPFPRGPVNAQTLGGTDGFGVWSGTKHPDAAWELMKFVTDRYFQKLQAEVHLYQPARKSVLFDWYKILREAFPGLENVDLEVLGEAQVNDLGVVDELFKKPGASIGLYYSAIEAVMVTGKETPDYFKEVAEEITRINRED